MVLGHRALLTPCPSFRTKGLVLEQDLHPPIYALRGELATIDLESPVEFSEGDKVFTIRSSL